MLQCAPFVDIMKHILNFELFQFPAHKKDLLSKIVDLDL